MLDDPGVHFLLEKVGEFPAQPCYRLLGENQPTPTEPVFYTFNLKVDSP